MDRFTYQAMYEDVEHNPLVDETLFRKGYGTHQLEHSLEFLTMMIKSAVRSVEGLEFLHAKPLTAEEAWKILFDPRSKSPRKFELTVNDTSFTRFRFSWNGEEFDVLTNTVFGRDGGLLMMSDTLYTITPVQATTVLSITHDSVVVNVLANKGRIMGRDYTIRKNGKFITIKMPYNATILDSRARHTKKTPVAPLILYHLINKGLDIKGLKIHRGPVMVKKDRMLYQIGHLRPARAKEYADTVSPIDPIDQQLSISIPMKNGKVDPLSDRIATGIIYMYHDHPDLIKEIESIRGTEYESKYWMYVLGVLGYPKDMFTKEGITTIESHIDVISNYLDEVQRFRLKMIGLDMKSYFELLDYIAVMYSDMVINYIEYNSDPSKRYLDTLYFLMYPLVSRFNKGIKRIKDKLLRNQADGAGLDLNAVKSQLTSEVYPKSIAEIVGSQTNLALTIFTSSNDSIYFRSTCMTTIQEKGSGVVQSNQSSKQAAFALGELYGYDLANGTIHFLTKKDSSAKMRLNLFTKIDYATGKTILLPHEDKELGKLDKLLRTKIKKTDKE